MVKFKEINARINCRNYLLPILDVIFSQFAQFVEFERE